jgi:small subunit ribosomal protein S18
MSKASKSRKADILADKQRRPIQRELSELVGDGPVDYKDVALLKRFLSAKGGIRARRVTGLTVQQQRRVATAVRNAREMALLPYRN